MSTNTITFKGTLYATESTIQSGSATLYETKELKADSLEANSLSITVHGTSNSILSFKKNDKIEYFKDDRRQGVFYLQSVKRTGPEDYSLYALSTVGRLMTMRHPGGLYTGQTVTEVVQSIFGSIPVLVQTIYANTKLYGYLPYADGTQTSARDNLVQVLFAIGAYLDTDENGISRVQKLWDGMMRVIDADVIATDNCNVQQLTPVSAVEVSEHQWIKGTDEVTVFEGSTQQEDTIVFSEPIHSLAATGFTILDSGDNYAVVSSGNGTLTGKTYVHTTRVIRKPVTEDVEENVISVTDATLVSLVNSSAIATQLVNYYKQREIITADIIPASEKTGYVVGIYHPWDKKIVSACIQERETSLSNSLITQSQFLVNFLPPQPVDQEYFTERQVLTGSGQWTADKDGELRVVLIGGGQGGHAGKAGEDGKSSRSASFQIPSDVDWLPPYSVNGYLYAEFSLGGLGGTPGAGGKILEATLQVSTGDVINFSCGLGGIGADYTEEDLAGSLGTDTVFGTLSSANGSTNPSGFVDPTTGNIYAPQGNAGIAGGNGGGSVSISDYPHPSNYSGDYYKIGVGLTIAESVTDEDGKSWSGGDYIRSPNAGESDLVIVRGSSGNVNDSKGLIAQMDAVNSSSAPGGAAGGALGDNGKASNIPSVAEDEDKETLTSYTTANIGGAGATPILVPKTPAVYGQGGKGGYGGGAGGSASIAFTAVRNIRSGATIKTNNNGALGGKGGKGGKGAPGCIILYYSTSTKKVSGPFVQKNGGLFFDRLGKLFLV